MLSAVSYTDQISRDTTISYSDGEQFRMICAQWGIPAVAGVPTSYWREAVKSNALGPRGKSGALFEFLYYALGQFHRRFSVTATGTNEITIAGDAHFSLNDTDAWVRRVANGDVWRAVGPDESEDIETLTLCTQSCYPYWKAAHLAVSSEVFDVEVLAFTIHEEPGLVVITTDVVEQNLVPPTYLQDGSESPPSPAEVAQSAGTEAEDYNGGSVDPAPDAAVLVGAADRQEGQPFGGHLLLSELDTGGLASGPHPIYLGNGASFDDLKIVLDALLPAGVQSKFQGRVV